MTTTTFDTAPQGASIGATLSRIAARFRHAIDELVASRARRTVPEWQLRRIRREISRYDSLMHAEELNHPIRNKHRRRVKTVRVNAR
jgi:hypothetical protein